MSEMNYLKDIEIHQFDESMTLAECGFETMAMAEHEWAVIQESVDVDGLSLFEAELLGLDEASSESFGDKVKALGKKIIELLKKIASYIMGVISKWIVALMKLVNKDKFKAKDKARLSRGAANLTKEGKSVKMYGLLVQKHEMPAYDAIDVVEAKSAKLDDFKFSYDEVVEFENGIAQGLDDARGALAGINTCAAKDFKAAINEYMTGHKDVAEYEFSSSNIDKALETAIASINGGAAKQKSAAKKSYEKINGKINKFIDKIKKLTVKAKDIKEDDVRKNAIAALNAEGRFYKSLASVMSSANSACMSVLSADYRMNATLVLKCYAAGESDKKAKEQAKEAKKEEKSTNESVESIFGMDLI